MFGFARRGFTTAAGVLLVLTSGASSAWGDDLPSPAGAVEPAPDDGAPPPAAAEEELSDLSLEQLMAVSITTASNVDEKLGDAPASVIVITRAELEERGYRQLGDIFDDLPGMDVARPYGDNWVLVYWRGFRGDVSAPFLLMIDGLPVNSLSFVDVDVPLTAVPLSAVERIEVVQGPASSVYGPNAFMGVINVITLSDAEQDGVITYARIGMGSEAARIADATVFYKQGPWRLRVSARFETGVLDDAHNDQYEFTRDAYYQDGELGRSLWGGFVDNPNLAGSYSRHAAQAAEVHLFHENTELAVRGMSFASGYGVEYTGDRVLNNSVWNRYELDAYLRHQHVLTRLLTSRTVLRYRGSGIASDSFFVDGYTDETEGRLAAFSYWQSRNTSWSAYQDVTMTPVDGWSLVAGLKLEQKDLQKAYNINGEGPAGTPGGYQAVDTIDASTYWYPEPPQPVREAPNRILTEDFGAYAQLRRELTDNHHVHLGGRVDRNSGYDVAPTVRAGYVGRLARGLVLKTLYGQAFQEPPPRVLYGGWTGSGSDPALRPQRSQTFELDATLTLPDVWQGLAAYAVRSTDTISAGSVPRNSGEQLVLGLDWSFRAHVAVPHLDRLELSGSYTRLFHAEEELTAADGSRTVVRIGDLSRDKLHLGATARYDRDLSVNLRGRWFGRRTTTPTNPLGAVDGYATLDATLAYRNIRKSGVGVSATMLNVTDARYVHPGINDASGGDDAYAADGSFVGSQGFFSSAMPQPGRAFLISLWLAP